MQVKELFTITKKGFIWIAIFNVFVFCKKIEIEQSFLGYFYYLIFQKKEFDPCDPFYSYYENKTHYFYDENLKKDGTIDYSKLLELRKVENHPCDPLKRKSN